MASFERYLHIKLTTGVTPVLQSDLPIIADMRFERRPFRVRTPAEIADVHRFPGMLVRPVQLINTGGHMVFLLNYSEQPSVHPVGLYNEDGEPCRFPTRGLIHLPGSEFPYTVKHLKTLKTRQDVENLATTWTAYNVDSLPRVFEPLKGTRENTDFLTSWQAFRDEKLPEGS